MKLYATYTYIPIAPNMRTQELQLSNYSGYVLKILRNILQ
jgi:hypothetical protein